MTMVASFMPSLAFAASEHSFYGLSDGCAWSLVQAQLDAENSNVEVVTKATHTEKGVVNVKCATSICDEVVTIKTATLPHQLPTACANKDLTIDALADQMLAQRNIPGALTDSDFASEQAATAWVKSTKADPLGYCYMKNAKVCSCGVIIAYGTWQFHSNTKCTDEPCGECGATLEGTGHSPKTPLESELATLKKVSEPTCGHGTGYEVECTNGCGIKTVWYHDADLGSTPSDKKTDAHNYGTKVAASTALKKIQGGFELKSGYVALNATTDALYTTGAFDSEGKVGSVQYDFYQFNKVTTAPTCTVDGVGALVCTVCDYPVATNVVIPATGHDWEKTDVAATCDHNAYVHKVCTVCKEVDDTEVKANTKLAHSYKVSMTNANCKGAERYTIECTTCEAKCANAKETVAAPGALDVYDEDTDSVTVLWDGLDNELSRKDAIQLTFSKKAVAHKYGKKELLKAADCENDEVWGYKCTECGKINIHGTGTYALDEKANTALGHDHPTVEVAATCVNKAYTAKAEECTRCGKTDPAIVTANSNALKAASINGGKHAFDKWVVTKAPTVFEEGVKTLTCSVCGTHDDTKTVVAKKTVAKAVPTVKAGKKSLTVKATAANATGYKVSYKKSGAKSWKTVTVNGSSLSKTIKKLSSGKKYYVKVQAFAANDAGDVVNGATSATKSVKVK